MEGAIARVELACFDESRFPSSDDSMTCLLLGFMSLSVS